MSDYEARRTADYFDQVGLEEWERLVATPVDEVNLYLHTHYLRKHVPAGARILEIGAGAGRFTQALAEMGARIVVGDVSEIQLDLNRRHSQQYGFAHAVEAWHQIDMCDMSEFADSAFDIVVAYGGPLSYVLDQRDVALQECLRVLKPGGVLALSVMSIWGSAHHRLDGVLSLPVETNRRIVETGDLLPQSQDDLGNFCHMFRAGELHDWLTAADLRILDLSASNCLSLCWGGMLTDIRSDDEKWQELLRMELEVCADAACVGMGTHMIAVVQR